MASKSLTYINDNICQRLYERCYIIGVDFMWTVVYMAQSKEIIQKLQELLEKEGLLVKIRPISKNAESDEDNYYEVLVPESEVEEAHTLIIETGY